METLQGAIISYAVDAIGQTEIKQNQGFKDEDFEKIMRDLGRFKTGYAWCSCFCEAVWRQAFKDFNIKKSVFDEMAKLITPGAVKTFRNFKKSKNWTTSDAPAVGAIAIWQKFAGRKGTTKGHAAIVESFTEDTITTIDGNSNAKGGRNGGMVWRVTRKINIDSTDSGLVLLGFVYPV